MGRRRRSLPASVLDAVMRSEDAELWGVGRSRLRREDVHRPYRGAVAFRPRAETTLDRCRAYESVRLIGQFYSHVTAADLWGIPLPSRFADESLHVSVQHPRTAPRRPGVLGHSLRAEDVAIVRVQDLPCAGAPDTWCQLAPLLAQEDLVAAGDYLISPRRQGRTILPPVTDSAALRAAARRYVGARGAKKITWALPRLRTGVASRPETHLRLLIVEAGLPEPLVADPTPVENGVVLHPDLKFVRERLVLDYEGDGHRSDDVQWRRDLTRREMLEAAGWHVMRVTSDDLYVHRDALVTRIRRRLRDLAP